MPQSLAAVYLHVVFSTKQRQAFLTDASLLEELHAYLGGIARELDCTPRIVGGTADHVHLLLRLSRNITTAHLVKELKRVSTLWLQSKSILRPKFHWQTGYRAFSVSPSNLPEVVDYIRDQALHHRNLSFQDEFRRLLHRHEIHFDERYLWD